MTPELAPPLLTTTPHQRKDVSALDRFNVHRCPTQRVFSGTGLELVTRQATIRYLYHSATAATCVRGKPGRHLQHRDTTVAKHSSAQRRPWKAEFEERMNDCISSLDFSNAFIVHYPTCNYLFHTTHGTFHHLTALGNDGVALKVAFQTPA
ncbi:uncharacterized protein TNCV_2644751 [Trichonephila clavipes]|nr:uncharacterized protein TNCV_2644751 [Trichonephila clavipes]